MIKIDLKDLEPVSDRVFVIPHETENEVEGFIIPDNAREKPSTGEVFASGPGTKDVPNITRPGDIVLFGKYSGADIVLNEKKLLILRESDIGAILKRANDKEG